MADVAQTKYKFSDSYSGVPTGIFNGAAGGYHFGGGWDAETDRRASKRAEGLQLFKDYVQTLTDNGIVPNQDSLRNFLGNAGDFGLNASYGFDPYAAQQMMESAIVQGQNKKREIAEKKLKAEAENSANITTLLSTERGNYRTMEETLENVAQRNPDIDKTRIANLAATAEQKWNDDVFKGIDVTTKGVIDEDSFEGWKQSNPNSTEQQQNYYKQAVANNRTTLIENTAKTIGLDIGNLTKSDEELTKMAIARLPDNAKNDQGIVSGVVKAIRGNALNQNATTGRTVAENVAKSIPEVATKSFEQREKEEVAKQQTRAKLDEAARQGPQNRSAMKAKLRENLAKAKGNKEANKLSVARTEAMIDYMLSPKAEELIGNAKTESELKEALADAVKKHLAFPREIEDQITLKDNGFTNPTRISSSYGTNPSQDYNTFVRNANPIVNPLIEGNVDAIQKARVSGIEKDLTSARDSIAAVIGGRLQSVRDGLASTGVHAYSDAELMKLESQYIGEALMNKGLTNEDRRYIFNKVYASIGNPPFIEKSVDVVERNFGQLNSLIRANVPPSSVSSMYPNIGADTSNRTQPVPMTPEQRQKIINESWAHWQGIPTMPIPKPVRAEESLIEKIIPSANAAEFRPARENVWMDSETGEATNTPYVTQLKQYPESFFNTMRYDDPRLNKAAVHLNNQYGLPTGLLNAIKNAGERSNNNQRPDFKKTGSTAQGVMQITNTTMKGTTKYGSLKHNRLNAVENMEAAAKLLSHEYQRLQRAIPAWSNANPLLATIIQYNVGSEAANKYIKSGRIDNIGLQSHQFAYLRRVLEYMRDHQKEEALEYRNDMENGTSGATWEIAMN